MPDSVPSILARLDSIKETVIFRPLTEDELISLEREVGLPIPPELVEYFRVVGLFQDLTSSSCSEYEVFETPREFKEARQFLLQNFGKPATGLFPFADDGAGNVVAAKQGLTHTTLFFADHETRKVTEIGTFSDWLSSVVDAALQREGPPNHQKKWCVQFTFRTAAPEPILEILRRFGPVQLGQWQSEGVTPAGVRSSTAALTLRSDQLVLKKSEYANWSEPMFSFDFDEPATLAESNSRIRKIDAAFRAAGLGYKLVDYGPLDMTLADEEEPQRRDKKPWWRFWA